MDAQRGLSVSGHRNTVLCLHLTSDTYHVTPSGRAPRARGKFWIRRVKLRIFRPDPKSHKSEGFPAAQIFKTHKCQNTYCRSAHFSKAVKFVGAQNPRGTPCRDQLVRHRPDPTAICAQEPSGGRVGLYTFLYENLLYRLYFIGEPSSSSERVLSPIFGSFGGRRTIPPISSRS